MYKVMFVDDEPWAVIDMIHSIPWKDKGFELSGYFDKPTQAFKEIMEHQPDIVFTDILMPVWDGFELIKQCRMAGSESEFIILSSYSDFPLAKQAIRSAVLDYCLKPVNPDAMADLLDEMRSLFDDRKIEQNGIKQNAYDGHEEDATGADVLKQAKTHEHFDAMLKFIEEHYHSRLVMTHLAEHFHYNKNYICYLFKKHGHTTFTTYLTNVRINEAKRLLRDGTLSQSDIAVKVGFRDYYYFNKVFKAECGITPLQYQNKRKSGI